MIKLRLTKEKLFVLNIKLINVSIILSFVFVIIKSYQRYNCLKNMCFYIGSPPKNHLSLGLMTYTGIMLLLPIVPILVRYFILKRTLTI